MIRSVPPFEWICQLPFWHNDADRERCGADHPITKVLTPSHGEHELEIQLLPPNELALAHAADGLGLAKAFLNPLADRLACPVTRMTRRAPSIVGERLLKHYCSSLRETSAHLVFAPLGVLDGIFFDRQAYSRVRSSSESLELS
jgi:hypothetical protein|nr:hypothetical protein [Mariprofundus ferrooxydans]